MSAPSKPAGKQTDAEKQQADAARAAELVNELNKLNLKLAYSGGKVVELAKVRVKPVPPAVVDAVKEALKDGASMTATEVKGVMVKAVGYIPEQDLTNHIKALEGMGVINYTRMDRKAKIMESEITLATGN